MILCGVKRKENEKRNSILKLCGLESRLSVIQLFFIVFMFNSMLDLNVDVYVLIRECVYFSVLFIHYFCICMCGLSVRLCFYFSDGKCFYVSLCPRTEKTNEKFIVDERKEKHPKYLAPTHGELSSRRPWSDASVVVLLSCMVSFTTSRTQYKYYCALSSHCRFDSPQFRFTFSLCFSSRICVSRALLFFVSCFCTSHFPSIWNCSFNRKRTKKKKFLAHKVTLENDEKRCLVIDIFLFYIWSALLFS